MESIRSYKDVRIATTPEKLRKLVSLPTFSSLHEFGHDVAAVHLQKEQVVLNRPYAVGFSILELAKLEMFQLYYDKIVPMFKDGKCDLLYTDTDSFIVQIHGYEDIHPVLKANSDAFDFHNLPENHCLYDHGVNKRKLGCLKLETGSDVCCEFVALSPKCYSILTDTGLKQAAKSSRKRLSHEAYKQCLLQDEYRVENVREIKSYAETMYQVSVRRRLLSPLDLKRYYLTPTLSLSFGHYKTKKRAAENEDDA